MNDLNITKLIITTLLLMLSTACANSKQPQQQIAEVSGTKNSVSNQQTVQAFNVVSRRILKSDGHDNGKTAYELITEFGGKRSIESPDLYSGNHTGQEHIYEAYDEMIGDHFVFVIHRDKDRDRDKLHITDRQRNEIKAHPNATADLKGFENETMTYQWLFKANSEMELSKRFTHFFQLKAKGGNDQQPIITLSGAERSGEDGIEVRYHGGSTDRRLLARTPWEHVAGEWLNIYVRATFAESASIRIIGIRVRDGKEVFNIDESGLDLWRGTDKSHFVRPKWGIYRSLMDKDNLRAEEEVAYFANFVVSKVIPNKQP